VVPARRRNMLLLRCSASLKEPGSDRGRGRMSIPVVLLLLSRWQPGKDASMATGSLMNDTVAILRHGAYDRTLIVFTR